MCSKFCWNISFNGFNSEWVSIQPIVEDLQLSRRLIRDIRCLNWQTYANCLSYMKIPDRLCPKLDDFRSISSRPAAHSIFFHKGTHWYFGLSECANHRCLVSTDMTSLVAIDGMTSDKLYRLSLMLKVVSILWCSILKRKKTNDASNSLYSFELLLLFIRTRYM